MDSESTDSAMAVPGSGASGSLLPVPVRGAQPPEKRHRSARRRVVTLPRLISAPSLVVYLRAWLASGTRTDAVAWPGAPLAIRMAGANRVAWRSAPVSELDQG